MQLPQREDLKTWLEVVPFKCNFGEQNNGQQSATGQEQNLSSF